MTRISSAQRPPNTFIDQMVNKSSDLAATAGGATAGAFDAHLATFNPNSGGKSKPEDANTALLKNPNDDIAAGQKDPADTVSALFAALKTEDQNTEAVNTNPAIQLAAQNQAATESQQTDIPLSALLSLANKAAPPASSVTPEANSVPDELWSAQPQEGTQKFMPPVSGEARLAANKAVPPTSNAMPGTNSVPSGLWPAQLRAGIQKSTSPLASADVKRGADSSKHPDANSSASSDLAVSAQVTIAAVAAALTPQVTVAAPAARNGGSSSGAGVNATALRSERTNVLSSSALPSDETQIQSGSVSSTPETASFDLFGGSSSSGEPSAQPVKMTLSSIQAETHFAPVQQLSPTQQIVDFVAATAGPAQAADTSGGAPAAGSQAPGMTASTATSLAGSPLKMLTLALEPDSLGTVTVTMRLVNSNLELKVEAEKPETTSLIEKDKGNLSDKLQSLGYSVDSMVVKTAAAQGSHLDPSNEQTAGGQGQQAANDASSSSASQNGGRNAQDQSQAHSDAQTGGGLGQETALAPASAARSIGDGIYL